MSKVTDKNRDKIIQKYIHATLDSMDFQALWDFAYDGIASNVQSYSNEELTEEILNNFPEILEKKKK